MVVEDEPVIVQLFRLNFEMRGFEVVDCDYTADMVEQALDQSPDIIILDLLMPLKSGLTILQELKADERTASIPVVICSVMSRPEDRRQCLDMGAADYITKPFDLKELGEVVERALDAATRPADRPLPLRQDPPPEELHP